jgi:hypothetical protein
MKSIIWKTGLAATVFGASLVAPKLASAQVYYFDAGDGVTCKVVDLAQPGVGGGAPMVMTCDDGWSMACNSDNYCTSGY